MGSRPERPLTRSRLRAAVAAWGVLSAGGAAQAAAVRVGLDRVQADAGRPLAGKRVGLVVHAASVSADGRHAIDVLRAAKVDVVRLFTPEHGLDGRAAAGETIVGGVDPKSGLPIVSLYGERTKPTADDLRGLDALVVDLQDVGVRFYTYSSTMLLCLEAAAEAGVELVVLDRPNPLGGDRWDGPRRGPESEVPLSLVSRAPGPLVHGLTLGEMARVANAARPKPARLTVVAMEGWTRAMRWPDTGREWVAPSPNLRSAEAALAYPGTCLFESTTATEGRGTEAPFLLLGAPWVDAEALAAVKSAGFALRPARFTPRASEAARTPKHRDVECAGARVSVTDASVTRPFELGLRLLVALRAQKGFAWTREGALDWLVGTRRLRESIERGETVEAMLEAQAADHAAWERERNPFLLY
jgi:uncharacterized protein YbbC (DUF1343 family)